MDGAPKQRGSSPLAVCGCVLAGGAGRRLGEPKATALLGGRPLVSYALEAFATAGIPAVGVAKADTPLPELGPQVEVWLDSSDVVHPLAGVVEAMRRSEARPLVACPCDLPFVSGPLLRW